MTLLELPDSHGFIEMVKRHFAYLLSNGFTFESVVRGTGDTVILRGAYGAVSVSYDRRDQCIDFSVAELTADNDIPLWHNFFGYLVRAGYRGSLQEFRNAELSASESNVQMYAAALQHFLPQLVADDVKPLSTER